jgi:RNA polymerase sigma-54 factor
MFQSQRQTLRQQQQLRMAPQLYQAIRILALPLQELRNTIQEELERNPALEVVEDNSSVSIDEAERRVGEEQEYFDDASDAGYVRTQASDSDEDPKRKFLEGVLTRPESLHEHLLWQLRLLRISEEEFRVGELLIRNLDENGFHIEPPESLVTPELIPLMERVKAMIQGLDPVGTCSAGYKEALLAQIRLHPNPHPRAAEVVEKHLTALEHEKYREIARSLRTTAAEVERVKEFLRELDPMPGRNFSSESPRYVIPDLAVKIQDGEIVIVLNDEEIPVLGVSPFYTNIREHQEQYKQKEVKRFVKNSLQEARWFIRSIRQRNETLIKVSKAIVEFQRDFFRRGPKSLVPLALKDIAAEVGVHEATVSRVTNGKYVQTEWGIFELKYFFSNSVPGAGRFSKEGVKQVLKEIIEQEGARRPLTDQKIGEILETQGIRIARRTIAKYRKELDIMSSHHR